MKNFDKISLSGQMFDALPVWDHIEAAAAAGYTAIELRSTHANPNSDPVYLARVKEYCNQKNLKILALSCFVGNFGLNDDDTCQQLLDLFEEYLELACYMEAEYIRLWPAWQESASATEDVFERSVYWCRKCVDLAARKNKKVVFEIHHGTICDTPESSKRFIDAIDHKDAGLILDPVNLYQVPVEDIKQAVYLLADKIFIVHVKDIIRLPSGDFPYSFEYSFYAKHIGRFTKVIPPTEDRSDYYAHRRIGQGGLDWSGILTALKEINYQGYLTVESVNETNKLMPEERELALSCYEDLMAIIHTRSKQKSWNIVSPSVPGLHTVISPETRDCKVAHMLRLNLSSEESYTLASGDQEMNVLLVAGAADIVLEGKQYKMDELDSFYIPGNSEVLLTAQKDSKFYIGAAVCEGHGSPFFRKLDLSLPLGEIHQIHGQGSMKREVFFTLDPATPASRLLCGISWGELGGWTSWPPHQHEQDLEEVYCYFDTNNGIHLSYLDTGDFNNVNFYPIKDGHMVLASQGYHPTVATPGNSNSYFWVLTAFNHESRRYDLAKPDPAILDL